MRDQLLPEEVAEEGQRQHNLITRAVDHPEMVAHELFSARTLIRVAAMSGDSESSPDDPAASALDNRSAGFPEILRAASKPERRRRGVYAERTANDAILVHGALMQGMAQLTSVRRNERCGSADDEEAR